MSLLYVRAHHWTQCLRRVSQALSQGEELSPLMLAMLCLAELRSMGVSFVIVFDLFDLFP